MDNCTEVLKEDILEYAQKRQNDLRDLWTKLRMKYNELDAIMCEFFNDINAFVLNKTN